jgi:hypothetical protein
MSLFSGAGNASESDGNTGKSDFFSVLNNVVNSVGNAATAIAPIWTNQQKKDQTKNQTLDPLYMQQLLAGNANADARSPVAFGLSKTELVVGGVAVAMVIAVVLLRRS